MILFNIDINFKLIYILNFNCKSGNRGKEMQSVIVTLLKFQINVSTCLKFKILLWISKHLNSKKRIPKNR